MRWLRIDIRRADADRGPDAPHLASVSCEHGVSTGIWSRLCANGCHGDPARRGACRRVSPSDADLRLAGVRHHGQVHGCRCPEPFWMRHGPRHRAGRAVGEGPLRPTDARALA